LWVKGIGIVVPEAIETFYDLMLEGETTEACGLELGQLPVERDAFAGSNLGGSSLAYDCRSKKRESGEPFFSTARRAYPDSLLVGELVEGGVIYGGVGW
jgi:hypothetical protein